MPMASPEQVSRELFETVTDQILERLENFDRKFDKFWEKSNSTDAAIHAINLTLAKNNVEAMQMDMKELRREVEELQRFKVKVLTGLVALNIAATIIGMLISIWLKIR